MANTKFLKCVVEPFLREWTANKLDTSLEERAIEVGRKLDGSPALFKFDGVSPDGKIGVVISASISYKIGQGRKYFMEATLLNQVSGFERRIMVSIERNCWDGFKAHYDGRVDLRRIEGFVCPVAELPDGMYDKITALYSEAAKEVGDKSGPGKWKYSLCSE